MNKAVILIVLPCIVAIASVYGQQYGYGQQYPIGYGQQYMYGQQRNVAPYAAYAANSYNAVKQARLFNYLLGGLYFLNLFNFTGNRIAG